MLHAAGQRPAAAAAGRMSSSAFTGPRHFEERSSCRRREDDQSVWNRSLAARKFACVLSTVARPRTSSLRSRGPTSAVRKALRGRTRMPREGVMSGLVGRSSGSSMLTFAPNLNNLGRADPREACALCFVRA